MKNRLALFTFLLLLELFPSQKLLSQVGINTTSPQGILHIDPFSDTVGSTNQLDDVVVTSDGNVGLGILSARAKLHIKTIGNATMPFAGFQLQDGNEGDERGLVSVDDTGLSTWKAIVPRGAQTGNTLISANNKLLSELETNYYLIGGGYIDLPPGRWVVIFTFYMRTEGGSRGRFSIHVSFTEQNLGLNYPMTSASISSDIEEYLTAQSSFFAHYGVAGVLTGSVLINNQSTASKRYYSMIGNAAVYPSTIGTNRLHFSQMAEDVLVAYLIPFD